MTDVCGITEIKDGVMKVNCLGCMFGSSVEDFDVCMARTIDKLMTEKNVMSFVLAETREYEYNEEQTRMLKQIGEAIIKILREKKLLSLKNFGPSEKCQKLVKTWYPWITNVINIQLRGDPIGAYVNIRREIRHIRTKLATTEGPEKECMESYLGNVLLPIEEILHECELIKKAEPYLTGYHIGDRAIYRKFFHPTVRPNFMFTKYIIQPPLGQTVSKYKVMGADVEIFKVKEKVRPIYHIVPPEFRLTEDEYAVLDAARRFLEERRPKELELKDQKRMREIFKTISLDLVRDLTEQMGKSFSQEVIDRMANILTRYTAGLGVLELLLADNNVQDIYVNSPLGKTPIYIIHQEFGECETNLIPTRADGERWATRFRILSERPLDEANPVLDTEISVEGGNARVTAIAPRLSPYGLGFALRRFRYKPWTFPLFLNVKFFDPLFAGLMWFFASYGRTMLIAGTRGAGKTSLLGSLILQIIPYYRIITIEDTLELPVQSLISLGYNVERLKARSVITRVELELPADEALRTSLRLGDSCLFMGEVRSVEAKALFEAMRIGALANVVAGTIHGDSAYGVFDRVVNDLGVPPTSFKAVDLIVIANKLRTPDGLSSYRRVTEVTEVRKNWQKDPVEEGGFVNLMEFDANKDMLRPTDTLLNGESYILNQIAENVPGWLGRWDAIWDNIKLRGNILQAIVDIANRTNKPWLMEAETTVAANQMFHMLCEQSRKETGSIDTKWVYEEFLKWLKEKAKK